MSLAPAPKMAERLEIFLRKARDGARPMGVGVGLPSTEVMDILATFDFDWVLINQEHTLINGANNLAAMIRAAEGMGVPIIVKPNEADPLLVRDAMDAGAYGVLLPFTESAPDLKELVDSCRFPPIGTRAVCSLSRATHYGTLAYGSRPAALQEYVEFVNEHMLFVPTIESIDGVENLDEILALPDFPLIHVGLEDLAMSLKHDGRDWSYAMGLAKSVSKKIRAAGKMTMLAFEVQQSVEDNVAVLDALHVDVAYGGDTSSLALGLAVTVETADAARRSTALSAVQTSERKPKAGG